MMDKKSRQAIRKQESMDKQNHEEKATARNKRKWVMEKYPNSREVLV